jgi:hypothetical protein
MQIPMTGRIQHRRPADLRAPLATSTNSKRTANSDSTTHTRKLDVSGSGLGSPPDTGTLLNTKTPADASKALDVVANTRKLEKDARWLQGSALRALPDDAPAGHWTTMSFRQAWDSQCASGLVKAV